MLNIRSRGFKTDIRLNLLSFRYVLTLHKTNTFKIYDGLVHHTGLGIVTCPLSLPFLQGFRFCFTYEKKKVCLVTVPAANERLLLPPVNTLNLSGK